MSKKKQTANNGITFAGALALLFIALKLTHFIDWSWWWVTSPLWIGLAIIIAIMLFVGVVAGIALLIAKVLEQFGK